MNNNTFSQTITLTYNNGMKLYILPRSGPTVEVECFIKTGSIHEEEYLGYGLSHFLEHMLFQGCKNYPGTLVADKIAQTGGSINAYTSYDRTVYHTLINLESVPTAIDVIANMVRYPELPEERFIKEKDVILREIDRANDNGSRKLFQCFMETAFNVHPAKYPIIGFPELASKVTREMAYNYHQKRYNPNRCFWVIVGNVDVENVYNLIGERLGDWERKNLKEIVLPSEGRQICRKNGSFIFEDTVSRGYLLWQLNNYKYEDLHAAEILLGSLAGSAGSLLVNEFENKKQLALAIRNINLSFEESYFAGFSFKANPKNIDKLEKEVLKTIDKVANGELEAAAIEREKRQQYADYLSRLQSVDSLASIIGQCVMETNNPATADIWMDRLEQVTFKEVIDVAQKLFIDKQLIAIKQDSSVKKLSSNIKLETPILQEDKIAGNVKLTAITDTRVPMVSAKLLLPAGAIYENYQNQGISNIISMMLTTGTQNMSEETLMTALDEYGANFRCSSGLNSLFITIEAPKKYFDGAIKILKEIITYPLFGQEEFAREQDRRLQEYSSNILNPSKRAYLEAKKLLFKDHPYSWGKSLTCEENFSKLTSQDALTFYKKCWNKDKVVCGFAGDITLEEAKKLGEFLLDEIQWTTEHHTIPALPNFPTKEEIFSLELPREQTVVFVTLPCPKLTGTTDNLYMDILREVESGLNSHLFKRVREDNALAYHTSITISGGIHPGNISFFGGTGPNMENALLELLKEEIQRLGSTGIDQDEFDSAKAGIRFSIAAQQDTPVARLESKMLEIYFNEKDMTLEKALKMLDELTLEEYNKYLKDIFSNAVPVTSIIKGVKEPKEE